MSEDAGLRARIEAQVAARRAGAGAPEPQPPPEPPPSPSATGLTPARPWQGRGEEPVAEPPKPPAPSNPEIVLQSLAAEVERPAAQHPSPGRRQRPSPRHASPADKPTPAAPSAGTARPLGISGPGTGASAWGTTNGAAAPDLSKFLEAAEPRRGDDEPDARPRRGGSRHVRRALVRTLVVVVIAAVAAMLLRAFVVQPFYIPSASMEPTLHGCPGCNDDHVLVDKISYRAHDVRAGDIVVFDRPKNAVGVQENVLIKRVIALPGDVVELKQGKVYVNGLVLDEPYLNKDCGANPTVPLTNTSKWQVPGNDVFVMGDNRCHSDDSRMFGPIAESSIIGRAFAIIWPVNRIRLL